MKLYFSRNLNPRVAVAVARHLDAPVDYVHAAPLDPSQQEKFRALNPNLRVPILVEGDESLWETDAIACRLSQLTGSDFWRTGAAQPEMIRWLSWGTHNFVAACDKVHFERVTKQRYGLGPIRDDLVVEGLSGFAEAATLLEQVLSGRDWLVGSAVSYADFRMASVLPFADLAGLPLSDYPRVAAWHARLWQLDAWRDPFAGLDAPELPQVSRFDATGRRG
ncbi:glutathione S-transferase family protein [Sorangium sp. So ce204]|uniref:glutathione S-transferase family protein n=1 Tax=Sorangium sp. So ce204 TaxID=3133288 RepID=UPI003F60005B